MNYLLGALVVYLIGNAWLTFRIFDQVLEIRLKIVQNEAEWICNCTCDDEDEYEDEPLDPEREPAPILKFAQK